MWLKEWLSVDSELDGNERLLLLAVVLSFAQKCVGEGEIEITVCFLGFAALEVILISFDSLPVKPIN